MSDPGFLRYASEGRHFDLSYSSPRQLGWKALAVNLSDIAAMGGRLRWALVNLGLRPELKVSLVEEIYAGIAELAEEHGVIVVGIPALPRGS